MNKTIFKRAINFFLFATSLTIIATFITYFINPDVKEVLEGIGNRSSNQSNNPSGLYEVWTFIVNNGFVVPLQMFLFALVPIQFLYVLNIMTTAFLPGVLFGIALRIDGGKGFGMILSTIPHYVFEIFAFCILAAILFELNRTVRIKVKKLFKKSEEDVSFSHLLVKTVSIYAVFVLPIIILAAFLETYIADIIFSVFQ